MTDRELLEAAAKAAGVPLRVVGAEPGLYCLYPEKDGVAKFMTHQNWNPLTDDGDALRLAVKLGIDLQLFRAIPQEFRPHDLFARACVDRMGRCFGEQVVDDPCAATRRAIVRAAAAMVQE